MRYVYSVVRFVPDPVRGEFVNVGVLAGSDESSEWQMRTIANLKRARAIDAKGFLPYVWEFVDEIGRRLDTYAEAIETSQEPGVTITEEWLDRLSSDSRNVVQLSQPTPIVAGSLDEALATLFEQFILEPETRQFSFQKKHTALAAIRRAFRQSGLVRGQDFEESALVRGAHHRERFDFMVANGRVVQLTQAWSFQVPGQEELAEKVKAWAWTVGDIRKYGGEAVIRDRSAIVPKDIEISAVYVMPEAGASSPALEEATNAFREVKVSAVPLGEAAGVGVRAAALLRGRV